MKVKLSEAFDLQMGKTPARSDRTCWGVGHKWISISDIGNAEKYIDTTKEEITDEGVSKSGIKVVPKGTVIMSFKLSIGKTAITAEDMYTNEAIMAFINKGKYEIDTDYLYHMCKGIDWLEGTNKAVLGLTLNKATMSEKTIEIPPMEVQQQVVAVLDKMEELIAMRKAQLAKLDQLVKSRFIELFGDPASNSMHWETQTFRQASVRLSDGPFGSNLKSEHYVESGIRVIRLGNIGVGRFINNDQSYISEEHYERLKKYTCKAGDIVIGTLGEPNLRACLVPDSIEYAINKADCVHYVPRPEILDRYFVCQYINCPETLSLASGMVHGQTRSRISSGQLAEMPIFIPPLALQKQFAAFVKQTDKSKLAIQQSLDKLETLKKSLMQEYFG